MLSSSDNVVRYAIVTTPAATYTIPFKYWATSEIKAVISFLGEADEVLDYTTDFTVSAAGDTGTLTRVGTWTADAIRLTIYRDIALVQETDYRNGDVIDAEAVEKSIDRLTALSQQINEIASRQINVPITDTSATLELPSIEERKNQFLGFDEDGNAIAAAGAAPVVASTWIAENILTKETADAVLTALEATSVGKAMLKAANKAAQQALISGCDAGTVDGHDLSVQTPLNSGLVCAPQGNVSEWPDNAAGTTYFQDAWATVDGWDGVGLCTLTFPSGTLLATVDAAQTEIRIRKNTVAWGTLKTIRFKYKPSKTGTLVVKGTVGGSANTTISSHAVTAGIWNIIDTYCAGDLTALYASQTSCVTGDTGYIDWVYIGDGTYTTKALDASGNGNHGTVAGATPVDTVAGKGFSFDGVNDSITHPTVTIANGSPWTIAWWQTETSTGLRFPWGNGSSKCPVLYTDNALYFRDAGNTYRKCTNALTRASLNHLMLVCDGATITGYVNGVVGLTVTPSSTEISLARFARGYDPADVTYIFGGTFSDPRIYNRALSADEIWELYQKPGMARLSGPIDAVTAVPDSRVVRNASGFVEATDPTSVATAGAVGYQTAIDVASGGTLTMPAGSGTYFWTILTYGATINSVKLGTTAAGAAATGTASANLTVLVKRIA